MGEHPQAYPTATLAATIAAALPHPQPANIAAALAAINVRSHIPFILELNSHNNSRWHEPFHTLVGKFSAMHHVDGTAAPEPPTPAWRATDMPCTLSSTKFQRRSSAVSSCRMPWHMPSGLLSRDSSMTTKLHVPLCLRRSSGPQNKVTRWCSSTRNA